MKRKFTLFLFALITSLGAWATSTYFVSGRSASITTGKQYMIYNTARRYFISANGAAYAVTSSTAPLTYTTTSANYVWTLEEGSASGTYKIKNVGTSTYSAGGTSLGSAVDYTIAEFSTCPSKGGMASYNDNGTTTEAASITSADRAVYIKEESGSNPYWNGTGDSFTTTAAAHVYVLYEVVEIEDDACYTIDFVSKDKTKTWGLKSGTSAVSTLTQGETGDVYVAHSYTNSSGNKRWIFVNNSNGTYLGYHGQASTQFSITNGNNEFEVNALTTSWNKVDNDADCYGMLFMRAGRRNCSSYPNNVGSYILNESNGNYDNSDDPFYNGSFTSALRFNATGDAVSAAATLAIAKFEALYEVKDYLTYASNISALFADPSSIETNINAAVSAEAAATVATNFMKSPEGKKFYAVNSTATGNYLNLGTSQITATATKLYAEAAMEVEYAGDGKYYLKGVKSGYYAGNPSSGSANPGTVSTKGSATPLYIGNYANSVDNVVYFARTRTESVEAIHYNSGYTAAGCVVAWTYNAPASQWNITAISNDDYDDLCNVCDVTYNVIVAPSGTVKAYETQTEVIGSAFTTVPSGIAKEYASYTYYSDVACTDELSVVPDAATTTVYALAATAGDAPFTVSTNFESATWYNLKLRDTYPSYADATPNVTLPTEPSSTENNVEWAFIGNPYDGYQIINKAAGDGKVLGAASAASDGANGGNTYATFATAGTQTYERWFPKSSTLATNGFYLFDEEDYALNKRSTANLAFWTEDYDIGSTFEAFAVTDNSAELAEIKTRLAAKTFGSQYGEYSLTGGYAGDESSMAGTIIPSWGTYSYSTLLEARGYDAAKSLNVPQAGDFLRIKASATNKSAYSVSDDIYLKSNNTQSDGNSGAYKDNRVAFELGSASDNTTIFYFDDNRLTGLANGLHPSSSSNQMKIGAVGVSTSIAFESIESTENKAFRVEFKADDGTTDRSLYTQRYSGVYFTDAAGGNETSAHYRYFLEKVTTLPITISAAGYATLYSPVALSIPSGITVYKATENGEYLTLTAVASEAGDVIPANQGFIIAGAEGSYNFTVTTGGSVDGNVLTGTVAAISRPDGSYILATGDSGVGFYKDGASTIPGFKAYYQPESPVKGFMGFFFEDDETAIENVNVNDDLNLDNSAIYNIAGQRLQKMQKGINIINGRKVVLK